MKKRCLTVLIACFLSCMLIAGAGISVAAADPVLENDGLTGFSAAAGTPQTLDGKTLVFNGQGDAQQDGIVYTQSLSGEYSVQFDVTTKLDGGNVFMVTLGSKSQDVDGTVINETESLTFVVNHGSVGMAREGDVSASGYKVYDSTEYAEITDPNKMGNAMYNFAVGNPYRFKFVVKENGDVDFYATRLTVSHDYPVYFYTMSKQPAAAAGETDGYFAFIPVTGSEVTFSNFMVNDVPVAGAFEYSDQWNIIGSNHTVAQSNAGVFMADNERIVSDFYFDDSSLSEGDVIFDITYRVKPKGTHAWVNGGWLTMGLMFGMEEKTSLRSASGSIETQWATLVRVCESGAPQTKVSGDGTGAASGYFVNDIQAVFRAVAKKGGTLDVYVTEGGNPLTDTIYQSYAGLDFNGYIAFYADDNAFETDPDSHGDIIFTEVAVNANPAAVVRSATGVTCEETVSLGVGEQHTLQATVLPENASNKTLTFASDEPEVATVDAATGVITAVGKGTATITVTAQDGEFTDTCTVTVTQPVTGVTLDKDTLSLNVGGTATLQATVAPADADNQNVTFTSSAPEVVTVNATTGEVEAVGKGTATITVTTQDGEFTDTCTVTVTQPVTGVSLDKETLSLTVGGNGTLIVTINPSDASNTTVTFESSNTAVATVDSNGVVRAVGAGTATITVTTQDGEFTDTCAVTVTEATTPDLDPDEPGTDPDEPGTDPDEPGTDPDEPGTDPDDNADTSTGCSSSVTVYAAPAGVLLLAGAAVLCICRKSKKS